MSRSGLSRSSITSDTTRQKLDELDALLQQMLNLPVNRLDPDWPANPTDPLHRETAPPPAPLTPDASVHSARNGTGTGNEEAHGAPSQADSSRQPEPSRAQADPAKGAHPLPSPDVAAPHEVDSGQAPLNQNSGSPADAPASTAPAKASPRRVAAERPPRISVSGWLYPLLMINAIFDGLTHLLGPVGRWLRGEAGRRWTGWAGLGFLVAALVWTFLDWMGWIGSMN